MTPVSLPHFCVFFQTLLRMHYDLKQQQLQGEIEVPCTHFVETGPSLLHEMPWVLHKDYHVRNIDNWFIG